RVVLLASHGLVVSGPSVAAVIDTNEAVVRTLADAVGRPAPAPPPMDRGALEQMVTAVRAAQPGLPYVAVAPALPAPPRAASAPAVLFPDAAVYCGATALPLPDGARPAALRAAAARYARRWRQAPRVWRAGDVALCAGVTASAARATADVFWAHEQVRALTAAPGLGGPRWLGTAAVRALLGWEAEAYRQQVAARAPR
ncbi:MAG TPA: hypothetical protein VEA38_02825, partial [Terriglobales bacterium]|nr:hypothetical protein [Terriglobales bacterium]